MLRLVRVLAFAACSLVAVSAAQAQTNSSPNLIVNGGFIDAFGDSTAGTDGSVSSQSFGGTDLSGWTSAGTNSSPDYWFASPSDPFNSGALVPTAAGYQCFYGPGYCNNGYETSGNVQNGFTSAPNDPNGTGNFIALDADPAYAAALSQIVSGLIPGRFYELSFYWAMVQQATRNTPYDANTNPNSNITAALSATFGGVTQTTSTDTITAGVVTGDNSGQYLETVSGGQDSFAPWQKTVLYFVATASTQTLTFLATNGTTGVPPLVLLTDVQLQLPEPASLTLLAAGTAGLAFIRRRRRISAA